MVIQDSPDCMGNTWKSTKNEEHNNAMLNISNPQFLCIHCMCIKTGGTGVAGRPVGGGDDGDRLGGTGIPILGAKPGTYVIYITNSPQKVK